VTTGQVLALVALGAFHGLNPGMGWLFAVAVGLQERSKAGLLRTLPSIAAGHAASVAVVAVAVTVTGDLLATRVLTIGGGLLLVGFGLWRLLSKRHFRWVGMRLSRWQLAAWSFLMSSVHGAGLMLLPVLIPERPAPMHMAGMADMTVPGPSVATSVGNALTATAVHTAAMVAVGGAIAMLIYTVVGLRILRTAWVNLDKVWAVALVGAGAATLLAS
jgi:hypothetical protein